nr:PREDICTED: uncharacterized protein LOC105674425 [Linepithema humile]
MCLSLINRTGDCALRGRLLSTSRYQKIFPARYLPLDRKYELRLIHFQSSAMRNFTSCLAVITLTMFAILFALTDRSTAQLPEPKAPNFQYFERPRYRYPYYDENGKGKLLYGYGGPELYQYKTYSALEGIH